MRGAFAFPKTLISRVTGWPAACIRDRENLEEEQTMALDVNGYNSVFKSFVDFAQERIDAN
jgi:hypothetical protein